jgi:hypothetical protein
MWVRAYGNEAAVEPEFLKTDAARGRNRPSVDDMATLPALAGGCYIAGSLTFHHDSSHATFVSWPD